MVTSSSRFEPSDELIAQILSRIRRRTRQGQFDLAEEDDVVQDVYVCLQIRSRREPPLGVDPAIERHVVIESILSNLARYRRARKRQPPGGRTLHLVDILIHEPSESRETGRHQDLVLDVANLLAFLPPQERQLANELMLGSRLSEVAKQTGIARSTLQDQVRRIRFRFEEMGYGPTL